MARFRHSLAATGSGGASRAALSQHGQLPPTHTAALHMPYGFMPPRRQDCQLHACWHSSSSGVMLALGDHGGCWLQVMAIAKMMQHDFPSSGVSLSGIGGVNTGRDAAEFILLGADTVQVRWVGRGFLQRACFCC